MLQVKNVKTFTGNEGHGFNAALYFNEKRVAVVTDHACGGDIDYAWEGKTPAARAENEKAVRAYVDGLPPETMPEDIEEWEKTLYTNGERQRSLDEVVSALVDDYENEKVMARKRKHSVLWVKEGLAEGEYYATKHNGAIESTKAAISRKHPDAKFI